MTKAEAIAFLTACSASDLIDVFTRATTERSSNSAAEVTDDIEDKLVLCHAWRCVGPHYDDKAKEWELEIVTNPTPDRL